MNTPAVYSQRLGAISNSRFQAVSTRLGLGRFLEAKAIASGLFGQNVFMHTTAGEFVLRGAPHWVRGDGDATYRQEDRWQFTKERFFAQQLHERTSVPVPWPMRHDQSSDLLGWPYLVMPRMPGECFDERSILKALSPEDRVEVAGALGRMLAQMQQFHWPSAGDVSPVSMMFEPVAAGNTPWVINETLFYTAMAQANGAITPADRLLVESVCSTALELAQARPITFVHGDYKLDNLTLLKDNRGWRVAGVFDLHTARFGDGALDIVRQACSYLDTEPAMVTRFLQGYLDHVEVDASITQVTPLYVVNERMKIWEYFSRSETASQGSQQWRHGKTFTSWADRYVNGVLGALDEAGFHV